MIKKGQIYKSCDPRGGPSIRVVMYTPGHQRANVVDAIDGKHYRSVLASSLHATGITKQGKPRRTGYRLVQDVEPCSHPADRVSRRVGGDLLCQDCDTVIGNDGGRYTVSMREAGDV